MPFSDVPPQYDIRFAGGSKPPMFGAAKDFGEYLKQLFGQNVPSYQGQIDPGLSPTMQGLGSMLQQKSMSPTPLGLSLAQGTLGKYMNPNFANATARAQFGAPSYFGFDPNAKTYGGDPMSNKPQMGMSGPMGQSGSSFLPMGGTGQPQPGGMPVPGWMNFWNGPPIPGLSHPNPNYPLPGGQPFPIPGFPGQPSGPGQPGQPGMPPSQPGMPPSQPDVKPMLPNEPVQGGKPPTEALKKPGQMTRADWAKLGITPGGKGAGFNDAQRKWLSEHGFGRQAGTYTMGGKTFTPKQINWLKTLSPEDQKKYGFDPKLLTGGPSTTKPAGKTFTPKQIAWLDTLSPADQAKYGYVPAGKPGGTNPPGGVPVPPRPGRDKGDT